MSNSWFLFSYFLPPVFCSLVSVTVFTKVDQTKLSKWLLFSLHIPYGHSTKPLLALPSVYIITLATSCDRLCWRRHAACLLVRLFFFFNRFSFFYSYLYSQFLTFLPEWSLAKVSQIMSFSCWNLLVIFSMFKINSKALALACEPLLVLAFSYLRVFLHYCYYTCFLFIPWMFQACLVSVLLHLLFFFPRISLFPR